MLIEIIYGDKFEKKIKTDLLFLIKLIFLILMKQLFRSHNKD